MNLHRAARVARHRTACGWGSVFLSARPLMAGPSFPEVGPEPSGDVCPAQWSLDQGWQMRESVLAGDDGADISQPDSRRRAGTVRLYQQPHLASSCGMASIPILCRHQQHVNPDGSDYHNRRDRLGRFSHPPDKSSPWARPYRFVRVSSADPYAGKMVWPDLDGINDRADVWSNGRQAAERGACGGDVQAFSLRCLVVRPQGTNERPGDPNPSRGYSLAIRFTNRS